MAEKLNRTCIACGKKYSYCNHCSQDRDKEPWHSIYCGNNCRKVFMATTDYLAKEITKEQAKEIFDSCDLSNRYAFKGRINEVIDEIYKEEETTTSSITPTIFPEVETNEDAEGIENKKIIYKSTKKK